MTQIMKFPRIPSLLSGFFDDDRIFNMDHDFTSKVPAANIQENDDNFQIEMAVPGMDKDDFHVNVENGSLVIRSEKEDKSVTEKDGYSRKEFSYNSFMRTFALPDNVNDDKIKASYKDGILALILPKREGEKQIAKKEIKIS